jgi:hypothetical protein
VIASGIHFPVLIMALAGLAQRDARVESNK